MIDSSLVKTVAGSSAGLALSFWDALPDILRVAILLFTLIHIGVRIYKEFK